MKNNRFYTNGAEIIVWDKEKCKHSAKCLRTIPYNIEKQGVYSIKVSENQFEGILRQARFCPAHALVSGKTEKLTDTNLL